MTSLTLKRVLESSLMMGTLPLRAPMVLMMVNERYSELSKRTMTMTLLAAFLLSVASASVR